MRLDSLSRGLVLEETDASSSALIVCTSSSRRGSLWEFFTFILSSHVSPSVHISSTLAFFLQSVVIFNTIFELSEMQPLTFISTKHYNPNFYMQNTPQYLD